MFLHSLIVVASSLSIGTPPPVRARRRVRRSGQTSTRVSRAEHLCDIARRRPTIPLTEKAFRRAAPVQNGLRAGGPAGHVSVPDLRTPRTAEYERMDPAAIVTFVLIAGFVWGGLILILMLAVRKEHDKAGKE